MNKKLVIGLVMVSAFILIAIFGSWIAPYDISHREKTAYVDGEILSPPFVPSEKYKLGTDNFGYDMLTKILYGAKYTVFTALIVSFFRLLIGATIGILLGIKGKERKQSFLGVVWGIIPTFLIVFFLLYPINFRMNREIYNTSSPFSFKLFIVTLIILILVGIPSIIASFRDKTRILMKNEYISAARILGANPFQILRKHILPHLKESLVTIFVTEITLVLTLLGQLGLFYIFIGGTLVYPYPTEYHSVTNEWAGLIGQYRINMYTNEWILLTPLVAYLLLIFSFQLLSEGLRSHYRKKMNTNSFL